MNFISRNKPLAVILALAFSIRFAYFFTILLLNPIGFYEHDSFQYLALARNIAENGTFSQMSSPPLLPDPYRTPLYPLFLAWIPGGGIVIILLQIILSTVTCWLTYKISYRIFCNTTAACIAAALVAMDVPSIIYSNSIMTETLFIFLLMISTCYLTVYFSEENKMLHLCLSALFMGLAILCRPIGLYLPLLILIVLSVFLWSRYRNLLTTATVYTGMILLTLLPWYLRNYAVFGKPFLSLIGQVNLCNFHGAAVYARVQDMEFYEAREKFWQELEKLYPLKIEEDVTGYTSFVASQSIDLMIQHPLIAMENHVTGIMHLLLKPARGDIERQTGMRKGFYTITETKNGLPATVFSRLFAGSNLPVLMLVFFQWIYLFVLYAGAALGIYCLARQRHFFMLAIILVIILYFLNMTLPPITYARFRVPLIPLLAILGAAGFKMVMNHRIFVQHIKRYVPDFDSLRS